MAAVSSVPPPASTCGPDPSLRELALMALEAEREDRARRLSRAARRVKASEGRALRAAIREVLGAFCPPRLPVRFDGLVSEWGFRKPTVAIEEFRFTRNEDGELYAGLDSDCLAYRIESLADLGRLIENAGRDMDAAS